MIRAFVLGLLCAAVVYTPRSVAAQRGEIAVLVGGVQGSGEEFDRVIASSAVGPSFYTRQRGVRSSGAVFGLAATFAIRGHVFAELGLAHHGVERAISSTGLGDETGPFLITSRYDGGITSLWMGPSYRVIDRERAILAAVVAPTVLVMSGEAFDSQQVFHNAPTRGTTVGMLLGLRGRYWLSERVGAQLSLEDLIWTFPLAPHPADGASISSRTSRETPRQHEIRAHLGMTLRLY